MRLDVLSLRNEPRSEVLCTSSTRAVAAFKIKETDAFACKHAMHRFFHFTWLVAFAIIPTLLCKNVMECLGLILRWEIVCVLYWLYVFYGVLGNCVVILLSRHYFFTYLLFLVAAVVSTTPISTNSFSNCLVRGPFNPIAPATSSVLYNPPTFISSSIS